MKLLKLILKNFKGVKSFELDTNGGNANVHGDNATGKTTLFDAFIWLLFDKDSQNKKDFQIKTLDENNNVLHYLEHEVEAVLEIDGKYVSLRKVYQEKRTRKRGSASPEFTGHTTDYFISDVPKKKSDFTALIASIADEEIFKLLTSPTFFNQKLHWKKRREILLEVCGDITDQEVIDSNKSLSKLPEILGDRKLDDLRDLISSRKTKINKELEKVPVRISEVNRGLPDIEGLDAEEIANKIDISKHFIEEKQAEIARIKNGGEVAEKRKQLSELESELIQLKNEFRGSIDDATAAKRKELDEAKERVFDLKGDSSSYKRTLQDNASRIVEINDNMSELREHWNQLNEKQFEFKQDNSCPTCGQALQVEKVEEARLKASATFNLEKSTELQKIKQDGQSKKALVKGLEAENAELDKKIKHAESLLDESEKKVTKINQDITNLQKSAEEAADNPAFTEKTKEIANLKEAITKLGTSTQESISKIHTEINKLNDEIETLESSEGKIKQHKISQKRIDELKEDEKKLAAEYEKLEGEYYLTEEFIKLKVSMLDEKINSHFKYARFKLFETQINGGLNQCCEALRNGVPWHDMNSASKIQVGLDVIETLSKHYGFDAPIFVDNAESITNLPQTKSQMIKLYVSKKDKDLRVELDSEEAIA